MPFLKEKTLTSLLCCILHVIWSLDSIISLINRGEFVVLVRLSVMLLNDLSLILLDAQFVVELFVALAINIFSCV